MAQRAVLFDFDGVLCKSRFYEKVLLPEYRSVYDWIQSNVFADKELVQAWMRNRIDSAGINRLISEKTGIEYEKLLGMFEESVRGMAIEKQVVDLALSVKASGAKIGIVTDNMDVFTRITVTGHRLDSDFDVVINSADYGLLKKDEEGRLFDIAIAALDGDIDNSFMVDDSVSTVDLFKRKGGRGLVYREVTELKAFLKEI